MPENLQPEPTKLDQILAHGYTIAERNYAPHRSSRHGFAKLEREGRLYFGKYSLVDSRRSSIETDIWWCKTIAHINKKQSLAINTPRIVDYGTGWYVAKWIDGQPSASPSSSPGVLSQFITTYATYLAQLDAVDLMHLDLAPPSNFYNDHTLREQLDSPWKEWTPPALAQGFLTAERVRAAHQVVDDFQNFLKPRLQHGDFVPWHILIDKQQTWWLIDGEHASPNIPRYFDLAYMYSRIFSNMHGRAEAAQLLQTFSDVSGQRLETIYPALLPVMTSRAIGMHFDAANDFPTTDYRAEAQDLLTRCLSRDPVALLD